MTKGTLLALATSLPLAAVELPPAIPVGPVTYDNISYQPSSPAPEGTDIGGGTFAPENTSTGSLPAAEAPPPAAAPTLSPLGGGTPSTTLTLNAYTSNYQVRGMGVVNALSDHGFSSLRASHTFANRNLFYRGIQHRLSGECGVIWDASCPLGDTPLFHLNYALGKEIFPNLLVELGYSLKRGGLEGYMARAHDGAPHRVAQDINLSLTFNDHQKGFFGSAVWGLGFQGLTGSYFDIEAGYRLTDVISFARIGSDVELSVGMSPSLGYWGGGVEGVDAYRIRMSLLPFSHSGSFGRDARLRLKPWVQCSWSGSNASKIDRRTGYGPVDHFQFTVGVDAGWKF